jgi:hypothetical protein
MTVERRAGARLAATVAVIVTAWVVVVVMVRVCCVWLLRRRHVHAHNWADNHRGEEHAEHDDQHHRRPANAGRGEGGFIDGGGGMRGVRRLL